MGTRGTSPERQGQKEELGHEQRQVPGVRRELLISIVSVLDLKESRIQGSLFPSVEGMVNTLLCVKRPSPRSEKNVNVGSFRKDG